MKRPVRVIFVDRCRSGGMADAADSKSVARKGVWVRLPPPNILFGQYQPKLEILAIFAAF